MQVIRTGISLLPKYRSSWLIQFFSLNQLFGFMINQHIPKLVVWNKSLAEHVKEFLFIFLCILIFFFICNNSMARRWRSIKTTVNTISLSNIDMKPLIFRIWFLFYPAGRYRVSHEDTRQKANRKGNMFESETVSGGRRESIQHTRILRTAGTNAVSSERFWAVVVSFVHSCAFR